MLNAKKATKNLIAAIITIAMVISLVPAVYVNADTANNTTKVVTTTAAPQASSSNGLSTKSVSVKAATASTSASSYLAEQIQTTKAESINMNGYTIKYTDNSKIGAQVGAYLDKFLNSHPELYYVGSGNWMVYVNQSTKTVTMLKPNYTMTKSQITSSQSKFNAAVSKIEKKVNKNWSAKKKAKKVNDLLKATSKYGNSSNKQNAYGVLVQHKGVCQSYTMAYEYIMNDLGVKTTYKLNTSGSHIWNKVYSGSKWHNVDVTWNETTNSNNYFWTNSHSNA